jgi:8-oxo-dGTP pyrophosphatase MutT (NUDIX family)
MLRDYPDKDKDIAGVILINRSTSRILLLQKHSGKWDLPKGHVDPGEKKYAAAAREAFEETGLEDIDVRDNVVIAFPSKSMLYFYLGFYDGDEEDVNISDEHLDYEWLRPSQAVTAFGSRSDFSRIIKSMCILIS